jgi:hypothetical protein
VAPGFSNPVSTGSMTPAATCWSSVVLEAFSSCQAQHTAATQDTATCTCVPDHDSAGAAACDGHSFCPCRVPSPWASWQRWRKADCCPGTRPSLTPHAAQLPCACSLTRCTHVAAMRFPRPYLHYLLLHSGSNGHTNGCQALCRLVLLLPAHGLDADTISQYSLVPWRAFFLRLCATEFVSCAARGQARGGPCVRTQLHPDMQAARMQQPNEAAQPSSPPPQPGGHAQKRSVVDGSRAYRWLSGCSLSPARHPGSRSTAVAIYPQKPMLIIFGRLHHVDEL